MITYKEVFFAFHLIATIIVKRVTLPRAVGNVLVTLDVKTVMFWSVEVFFYL